MSIMRQLKLFVVNYIKTQVYITLQQQYELTRIEEVKETPSVIILDNGKPAAEKEKPIVMKGILTKLTYLVVWSEYGHNQTIKTKYKQNHKTNVMKGIPTKLHNCNVRE